MSERLVIRLHAGSDSMASWVVVDDTGALLQEVVSGELAAAASATAGREVLVLVPAEDVLRTTLQLPVRNPTRLLQALPFAMEEQLAEDVELLHFAAGPRDTEGRLAVAVVRRSLLEQWLTRLAEAGIEASGVYSLADAMAGMPNTLTLLLEDDSAVVLTPDGETACVDAQALPVLLRLWFPAAGRDEAEEEDAAVREATHVVVYGAASALARLAPDLEALGQDVASLEQRVLAGDPLSRLAAHLATGSSPINLLQGAFVRRVQWLAWWPAWRMAAALLLGLLVTMAAVQLVDGYRSTRQLESVRAAAGQAFQHVFPDAGQTVDMRRELARRLGELGLPEARSQGGFLDMLAAVAPALGNSPSARIEGLSYRNETLELRIRAPSVAFLDQLKQQVDAAGGLQAKIQSANAAGEDITGRLQISIGEP